MMAEWWPDFLDPSDIMFRIAPMQTGGPRVFGGKRQVVASDPGFWIAQLSGFPVVTDEQILEWRGIVAAMEGELGDLIIGPFDERRAPVHSSLPPVIRGISHSDGSMFSDGSGYRQSTIKVRMAEDADLRATSAVLAIDQAGPLKRGMYFSLWQLEHAQYVPRMHIITKPPEVVGAQANVRFLPPLRGPVAADKDVDFADPKLLMNFSGADVGELVLKLSRAGRGSLDLSESWNGLS